MQIYQNCWSSFFVKVSYWFLGGFWLTNKITFFLRFVAAGCNDFQLFQNNSSLADANPKYFLVVNLVKVDSMAWTLLLAEDIQFCKKHFFEFRVCCYNCQKLLGYFDWKTQNQFCTRYFLYSTVSCEKVESENILLYVNLFILHFIWQKILALGTSHLKLVKKSIFAKSYRKYISVQIRFVLLFV